ncbi:hypothetical protein IBX73_05905, partial [candidate division WOR-3 bacterium]|nr:hypothetical protein [candidate division WOR-3 bacterium]
MNNHKSIVALILAMLTAAYAVDSDQKVQRSQQDNELSPTRADTIENFDDGMIQLFSYPGEDFDPDAWALDSTITFNNSAYSLKLWGNTWKVES